jgi:hypothetical protein
MQAVRIPKLRREQNNAAAEYIASRVDDGTPHGAMTMARATSRFTCAYLAGVHDGERRERRRQRGRRVR